MYQYIHLFIQHTKGEKMPERDWDWFKSPATECLNSCRLRRFTYNSFLKR